MQRKIAGCIADGAQFAATKAISYGNTVDPYIPFFDMSSHAEIMFNSCLDSLLVGRSCILCVTDRKSVV